MKTTEQTRYLHIAQMHDKDLAFLIAQFSIIRIVLYYEGYLYLIVWYYIPGSITENTFLLFRLYGLHWIWRN